MELCNIVGWCFAAANGAITVCICVIAWQYHKGITAEYLKARIMSNQCEELLEQMKNGRK